MFLKQRGKKVIENVEPLFKGKNLKNLIFGNLFVFAYGLLFDELGFILCTVLFTGACLKVIGKKRWILVTWVSLTVALVSYLVFEAWLEIQFPIGRLVRLIFG
jgi:hypothetical protein